MKTSANTYDSASTSEQRSVEAIKSFFADLATEIGLTLGASEVMMGRKGTLTQFYLVLAVKATDYSRTYSAHEVREKLNPSG